MNLTLGFGDMPPASEALAVEPVGAGSSSVASVAITALTARFEEAMQQDGSPVRAVRHQPARPAKYGEFPPELNPALRTALAQRGIDRLYVHQATAVEHALQGKNVVVVTPTASGKTLCYNLPVVHSVLGDAAGRAIFLFPTKALAEDQRLELQRL
ncbi:MAG: DEAD/DEAH box helicase, partial [Acidobacteriaceae bacterium]|nr:DEAD/DEAH box helicase [Acidobacteriaceae bacterium]